MSFEEILNIQELSEFLPENPKVNTIYAWVTRGQVPFMKKGKKLFFNKKAILEWDAAGRPQQETK